MDFGVDAFGAFATPARRRLGRAGTAERLRVRLPVRVAYQLRASLEIAITDPTTTPTWSELEADWTSNLVNSGIPIAPRTGTLWR
jgi:hypothetical protein